jgi:hypothetical protein
MGKSRDVDLASALAVITTPVVPRLLQLTYNEATEFFDRTGDCLNRVMLDDEVISWPQRLNQSS